MSLDVDDRVGMATVPLIRQNCPWEWQRTRPPIAQSNLGSPCVYPLVDHSRRRWSRSPAAFSVSCFFAKQKRAIGGAEAGST